MAEEENLPAPAEIDMSPAAIFKRREEMATGETISTIAATAQALATLQAQDSHLVHVDKVEKTLREHLQLMNERRDTSPLQEIMYLESRILHATFLNLVQQAAATDIHPVQRREFLEMAFKCQRHSRVTTESLARIVAPAEPTTVIQNTSAVQINHSEEKNQSKRELHMDNNNG